MHYSSMSQKHSLGHRLLSVLNPEKEKNEKSTIFSFAILNELEYSKVKEEANVHIQSNIGELK